MSSRFPIQLKQQFVRAAATGKSSAWQGSLAIVLGDRTTAIEDLDAPFRTARHKGLDDALREFLLGECLLVEQAGETRGALLIGRDPFIPNLLAAALLWLYLGEQTISSMEAVLPQRTQNVAHMVWTNPVDRIQAYVVATVLLQPMSPAAAIWQAKQILDDFWARSWDNVRVFPTNGAAAPTHAA